jgi:hypothetical protein
VTQRTVHAVVDEHRVRAAAGITMAMGAVAFAIASLDKELTPMKIVSTIIFVDFVVRVTAGLTRSPVGIVAGVLTRRHPPQWVSARPKRFAWTLGAVMAGSIAVLANSNVRGPLPMSICLVCLTLMWTEAVLGVCLGCELHAFLVRRGWSTNDAAFEVCSLDACRVAPDAQRGGPAAVWRVPGGSTAHAGATPQRSP